MYKGRPIKISEKIDSTMHVYYMYIYLPAIGILFFYMTSDIQFVCMSNVFLIFKYISIKLSIHTPSNIYRIRPNKHNVR